MKKYCFLKHFFLLHYDKMQAYIYVSHISGHNENEGICVESIFDCKGTFILQYGPYLVIYTVLNIILYIKDESKSQSSTVFIFTKRENIRFYIIWLNCIKFYFRSRLDFNVYLKFNVLHCRTHFEYYSFHFIWYNRIPIGCFGKFLINSRSELYLVVKCEM